MAAQREWFEKNYYQVLGVAESATPKEITKAYRKLARELHPDANPDNPAAEERFKDVSAAYDVVGDEERRKEYDEVRRAGPMGGFGGGRPGGGPAGDYASSYTSADLNDLFGGLFNRGGRRGGAGAGRGPGPQRGDDLEADIHLSFLDAVRGMETSINLVSEAACTTCHGSGAQPGTAPTTCPSCSGRGVIDDNQGFFSFSAPCQTCAGRGTVVSEPCPTCHGSGAERRPRQVKVRIPAGVSDGQRIRIKGRGGPGRNGGPPGDLYVSAQVTADQIFGRDGRNLTVVVPVTFPEAVLGTKLKVPTLDGAPVTLKLPAGTSSGRVFRVKGRGVESKKGTGDLLVTVEVAVPAKLTAEERKAVEALAAASTDSPRAHLGV
ncbi:MAG TPA: molecular chaperone DnaJ [Acidimicrobiales bacterium]